MLQSELISSLQQHLREHGDRQIIVAVKRGNAFFHADITKIWPLTVSDRFFGLVLDCEPQQQNDACDSKAPD